MSADEPFLCLSQQGKGTKTLFAADVWGLKQSLTRFMRRESWFAQYTATLGTSKIFAAYLVSVLVMVVASYGIVTPSYFFDEYVYAKMARSIVHLDPSSFADASKTYQPLYSLLISPAFLFRDMAITYSVIKIINSVTLSMMVFVTWWLLKKFSNVEHNVLFAFCLCLMPMYSIYPCFVISENLFLPLLATSTLLIVGCVSQPSARADILCGLALGLCYLTKVGVWVAPLAILLLVVLVDSVIELRNTASEGNRSGINTLSRVARTLIVRILAKWRLFLAFAAVFCAYSYVRFVLFHGSISAALGLDQGSIPFLRSEITKLGEAWRLGEWVLMHLNYGAIALGFVLYAAAFIPAIRRCPNRSDGPEYASFMFALTSLCMYFVLVLLASFNALIFERIYPGLFLNARYVDPALPAVAVLGVIGLKQAKVIGGNRATLLSLILSTASVFIFATPDMWQKVTVVFSAGMLYLLGVSALMVALLLAVLAVLTWIFLYVRRMEWKSVSRTVAGLLALFFIFASIGSHGWVEWAANYSMHEKNIAQWATENHIGNVTLLVDEDILKGKDYGVMKARLTFGLYFWLGNENIYVMIGNVTDYAKANYLVSGKRFSFPVASSYKTDNSTYYIYRVVSESDCETWLHGQNMNLDCSTDLVATAMARVAL